MRKDKSEAKTTTKKVPKKQKPALTIEGREAQIGAMAMNLAEQQIRDGTASSQVITHFLKIVSSKQKIENENLREQNELLKAKVQNLQSDAQRSLDYQKVIEALKSYTGNDD